MRQAKQANTTGKPPLLLLGNRWRQRLAHASCAFSLACLMAMGAMVAQAAPTQPKPQPNPALTPLQDESMALAAVAESAAKPYELTPDGLLLRAVPLVEKNANGFMVKPTLRALPQTQQLLVEWQAVALKTRWLGANLPLNQRGLGSLSFRQKGNSAQALVSWKEPAAFANWQSVKPQYFANGNVLLPYPLATAHSSTHHESGTLLGTSVLAYPEGTGVQVATAKPAEKQAPKSPPKPATPTKPTASPSPASVAEPSSEPTGSGGAVSPPLSSRVPLMALEAEQEYLMLLPKRGAGLLNVKQQFYLNEPNRFVVDLEPVVLNANLFGNESPATSSAAPPVPSSGVAQWEGWTLRLSQNSPTTVRLVIETTHTQSFELLRQDPSSPDAGALVIQPLTTAPRQGSRPSPKQPPLAELKQVALAPYKAGQPVKLRVEASQPLRYHVDREGNRLLVHLLNVASPKRPMAFDVKAFSYAQSFSLLPASQGATLVVQLNQGFKDVRHTPLRSENALEVSFLLASALPKPPEVIPTLTGPQGTPKRNPGMGRYRVVVDAGHGGKDGGTGRDGVLEKHLNLDNVLLLEAALKRRGVDVVLTRRSDVFLPLPSISEAANQAQPDVFVSIHHNASTNSGIAGIETYYYHAPSLPLARAVHNSLVGGFPSKDRGVRKAQFYVINHTKAPSILVEVGYLSNGGERQELQSAARQRKAMEAVAEGIMAYLKGL
jgi:N-acetylmuramoyl-L-alanine amidase